MKVLSIRQPWAWAIVHENKRIENRTWNTKFRDEFLIHASHKWDDEGRQFISKNMFKLGIRVFANKKHHQFGGIIGKATLVDVITESEDPYFCGPFGFVLENIEPIEFIPCKGKLGFWEFNKTIISTYKRSSNHERPQKRYDKIDQKV